MSLFLDSTDTGFQVVTAAAGRIEYVCDWADVTGSGPSATVDVDHSDGAITTAATTTVIGPPPAGTKRNMRSARFSNTHATVTQLVTVQRHNGTAAFQVESVSLAPGEAIAYHESTGMRVIGSNGVPRGPSPLWLPPGFFNVGVSAAGVDTYMGGFPIAGRIQQGSNVMWRILIAKTTAAGIAAPIYTFRVGTAGSTADTARVTITSAKAQTAVADTGSIIAWATIRTHGATGVLSAGFQLNHRQTAAGIANAVADGDQGLSATFDTTAAGLILGLSINPGASSTWVCDSSGSAFNLIA